MLDPSEIKLVILATGEDAMLEIDVIGGTASGSEFSTRITVHVECKSDH